mmetsp:Transcript_14009/g.21787  ORF Transcript_14009/g.21787 Transcript_14009/m.21787 type:complete len:372 (+) Transcript_14009:76-1191(+)
MVVVDWLRLSSEDLIAPGGVVFSTLHSGDGFVDEINIFREHQTIKILTGGDVFVVRQHLESINNSFLGIVISSKFNHVSQEAITGNVAIITSELSEGFSSLGLVHLLSNRVHEGLEFLLVKSTRTILVEFGEVVVEFFPFLSRNTLKFGQLNEFLKHFSFTGQQHIESIILDLNVLSGKRGVGVLFNTLLLNLSLKRPDRVQFLSLLLLIVHQSFNLSQLILVGSSALGNSILLFGQPLGERVDKVSELFAKIVVFDLAGQLSSILGTAVRESALERSRGSSKSIGSLRAISVLFNTNSLHISPALVIGLLLRGRFSVGGSILSLHLSLEGLHLLERVAKDGRRSSGRRVAVEPQEGTSQVSPQQPQPLLL